MRVAAAILLFTCIGYAQFKSTAPLVVAPTTVTDSKGRFVDGLTPEDLILYDNNVPQAIRMDWMTYPIDLVFAVQTSSNSGAVIDKLGGSDEVQIHQDFTGNRISRFTRCACCAWKAVARTCWMPCARRS